MARQTLSLPFKPQRMRARRERSGLSIQGLASRCAAIGYPVHFSYLGKVERGMHRPSAPLLKAIADALEIEVDELLDEAVSDGDTEPVTS